MRRAYLMFSPMMLRSATDAVAIFFFFFFFFRRLLIRRRCAYECRAVSVPCFAMLMRLYVQAFSCAQRGVRAARTIRKDGDVEVMRVPMRTPRERC